MLLSLKWDADGVQKVFQLQYNSPGLCQYFVEAAQEKTL